MRGRTFFAYDVILTFFGSDARKQSIVNLCVSQRFQSKDVFRRVWYRISQTLNFSLMPKRHAIVALTILMFPECTYLRAIFPARGIMNILLLKNFHLSILRIISSFQEKWANFQFPLLAPSALAILGHTCFRNTNMTTFVRETVCWQCFEREEGFRRVFVRNGLQKGLPNLVALCFSFSLTHKKH